MSDTAPREPSTPSVRFEQVVEQFLCEREQGGNPDPQRYLLGFPDLAPLLRDFFAGLDLFDRLAPDLAPTTPPTVSAQETLPGLGERVGNFELLSVLGRGGMGVVYKARQTNLNRVVALKMILSGSHASPSELARFRGEAEAVARLNHPNVVQVYEVGEVAGLPFFSLEYVEGGSLDRKLARSPLPPNEAAALVEKLARAMAVAHAAGLIHRDLKPANVLLAADGTPKITDFGLAKKLDTAGQTVSGAVLGTPSYMAPEQASGHSQAIGPAADIYALGATLYECLTGRPPFKAANPLDTMLQVLSDEPAPPRQLNARTPVDLETICLKCLRKEANRRYASAQALADDLGRYLAGEPIAARPVGRVERGWRWCRRHPTRAVACLLAGLLMLAPLVIAIREKQHSAQISNALTLAETHLRESRIQSATSTLERALLLCERGDVNHGMLWLARGLQTACLAEDENLEQAFRWNLGAWARQVHPLEQMLVHPTVVDALAFSPDGAWLATGCADGKVRLWELASGQMRSELAHSRPVRALAFQKGGKLLLTGCGDGKARLWSVPAGHPVGQAMTHAPDTRAVGWPSEAGILCVAFSPDGKTLATAGREGSARLWDADSCTQLGPPLVGTGGPAWTVAFHPDGQTILTGQGHALQQWDLKTRQRKGPAMSSSYLFSAAYSPDGKSLVAGYLQDRAARQWDLSSGRVRGPNLPHRDTVFSVCYSPDSRFVLSGSFDQTARVWDAATGEPVGSPLQHAGRVSSTAFSPDGKVMATSGEGGVVRVWKMDHGARRHVLRHPSWVRSVAFSPDGKRLLTGAADNACRLWDPIQGRQVGSDMRQGGWVMGVAFSADGKSAYGLSHRGDHHLYRHDVVSGQLLSSTRGETAGGWWRMAIAPDRTTIITGALGPRPVAGIWDAVTGQLRGVPIPHRSGVEGLAIDPNGRVVLTGDDRTIRTWDARTGESAGQPMQFPDEVSALAYSPDGKTLLVGSKGGYSQLWKLDGWSPAGIPLQHRAAVNGVAFAGDGNLLVTASDDNTVRLWYAHTSHPVGPILRHSNRVSAVAVSPDGTLLATASDDRTAIVWTIPRPRTEEAASLCGWVEMLTGLEMDERGTIRVLLATDWQQRQLAFANR